MRIRETPIFRRDLKKLKKKHYDINQLSNAVNAIITRNDSLLKSLRNHPLKGSWLGYCELHVSSDWLLIYQLDNDKLILTLTRTGSHDKLF